MVEEEEHPDHEELRYVQLTQTLLITMYPASQAVQTEALLQVTQLDEQLVQL
jgi:hypothetical protein